MLSNLLFLVNVDVKRAGVTVATISNKTLSLSNSLVKSLCTIHAKNWREFLVSHLF